MSYPVVLMIAAVLVSLALACQTYSAWRINASNQRYDEIVKADRNLFTLFTSEMLETIRAERDARVAEAELHRRAIAQSCRYESPPA
jgi:hypothetical protein